MLNLNSHQQKALQVKEIKALQSKIEETAARKFAASLSLASCIEKAHKWLKSTEGQTFLKTNKVGMEEFTVQVYGFQKSFYYKLLKVGQLIFERPQVVEQFKNEVEQAKVNDLGASLSVENLINFAKELQSIEAAAKGSEGIEESEGSEGKETAVPNVTKAANIVTFAFNGEAIGLKNVSLKIDKNGVLKTTCELKDIYAAIDYLRQSTGMKAEKVAKVDKAEKVTKKAAKKAEFLNHLDKTFRTTGIEDLSEHA